MNEKRPREEFSDPHKDGGKNKQVLDAIRMEAEKRFGDTPEFHGLEHTKLVAGYAKLIALGEGQDPFNAEAAGWTHDWGRIKEDEDPLKRKHAELSGLASKDFYRDLYEAEDITASQYGDIQRAVRRHSLNKETIRETL